jgi:hypothetical protein
MSINDEWLARIKGTMAVDVDRGISAGAGGPKIVEMLLAIPEVGQGLHLRANRGRPLAMDPATEEEKREIVDALNRVADWLSDGFHERTVDELRAIVTELETG